MNNLKKMAALAALPVMMAMSAPSFAGGFGNFDICDYDFWNLIPSCHQQPPTTYNPPVSVPEPATLALLGAGLAAAGIARRKKK